MSSELERAQIQYRALLVGLRWIASSSNARSTVAELRDYAKNVIVSTRLDTESLTAFVEESEKYADQFFGSLEDLFPNPTTLPAHSPSTSTEPDVADLLDQLDTEDTTPIEVVEIEWVTMEKGRLHARFR